MKSEKLPIIAAVLVYTSRASVRIGIGASLVLIVYIAAKLIGSPISDTGPMYAALTVAILSIAVWLLCGVIALIADRMRG